MPADVCSNCGRIIRQDPRTPGCYLGRCSTNTPGRPVPGKDPDGDELSDEEKVDRIEQLAEHPQLRMRLAGRAIEHGMRPD